MEFESSPGGWDDVSSSEVDEIVAGRAPVYYSEESEVDEPQPTLKVAPNQRTNVRAPQNQTQTAKKVNPLSGTSFMDRLPGRGRIDAAIADWINEQFDGVLALPFKKIGRNDGTWLFGLRRINIKIGQRTGQLYVDLGANSMSLIDFWGQYEYTEQRKIDGAAAGTQALLQLLQQG